MHAAVLRFSEFQTRYAYVLKLDVEKYFPSDELFTPFERRRGLPIGNLTCQFFANVYLDPIDHFIKEELRCPGYIRYMDDLCLFSDSKRELHQWHRAIEGRMAGLRLRLKASKSRIFSCRESIGFLGYRCLRTHRRIEPAVYRASLMSWLGHARWASTKDLLRRCRICEE
jgi:RNA-directed DNA polymerase